MTEAAKEKAAEIGAELIGKLMELGGRGLEGLFSSPWTGVPLVIIILSQLDPSGKMTIQFLDQFSKFLNALSIAAGNSLLSFGKGIGGAAHNTIRDALGLGPDTPTAPPPPVGLESPHRWFSHTTSELQGFLGLFGGPRKGGTQVFGSAADRDVYVVAYNKGLDNILATAWVDETWDQDMDINNTPIGPKLNDLTFPRPVRI